MSKGISNESVGGEKNREIADELDISQKAVEKQLTKALKFLREELKEYMPFLLILLG